MKRISFSLILFSSVACFSCSLHQASPRELFAQLILDPVPQSVTSLDADFRSQHEWSAYFHFYALADDRQRIIQAMDARKLDVVDYGKTIGYYADAPKGFIPPRTPLAQSSCYSGIESHRAVFSVLVVNEETRETFMYLQQL